MVLHVVLRVLQGESTGPSGCSGGHVGGPCSTGGSCGH